MSLRTLLIVAFSLVLYMLLLTVPPGSWAVTDEWIWTWPHPTGSVASTLRLSTLPYLSAVFIAVGFLMRSVAHQGRKRSHVNLKPRSQQALLSFVGAVVWAGYVLLMALRWEAFLPLLEPRGFPYCDKLLIAIHFDWLRDEHLAHDKIMNILQHMTMLSMASVGWLGGLCCGIWCETRSARRSSHQ